MAVTLSTLRSIDAEVVTVRGKALDQGGGDAYAATLFWESVGVPTDVSQDLITAPSVTTSTSGCMIALLGYTTGPGTAAVFSGSEPPVERLDDNTTLGSDAGLVADTFVQAAAGATGARTAVNTGGVFSVGVTVVLSPNGTPSFVAVGSVAKVASGDLTPGEPTGAASGDVLLLLIHQKDTVALTLSSDWKPLFDLVTRSGMTPSAAGPSKVSLWWHRRGGSAPSYLITRPDGDAGIAAVLAFRNIVATGLPVHRLAVSSVVKVVVDPGDSFKAQVTALFPGDDQVRWNYDDIFHIQRDEYQAVTVLKASHLEFNVGATWTFDIDTNNSATSVKLQVAGRDGRDDLNSREYELYDIAWSVLSGTGNVITLDTAGDPSGRTAVMTATGPGTDSVVVTAKNQLGEVITGTLPVTVLSTSDATITLES